MTMKEIVFAAALLGTVCLAPNSGRAQLLPPASDEVLLRVTQQELDEDAAGRDQKIHAEAMAEKFGVEPGVVETLRTAKHSWGEIATRLGSARELTKADPKTYGTMTAAVEKVGELRAQKLGWSAVMERLGLSLATVAADVQRVRQELKAQAKKNVTESVVTPSRALEQLKAQQESRTEERARTKSDRGRK